MNSVPHLKVKIGGRNFQIGCEPEEHATLRAAANMLNSEISSMQDNSAGQSVSLETAAVVSALNFAADLLRKQSPGPIQDFSPQIAQMIDKIDSALTD